MGYCPIELKDGLGAGLGTGRAGGAQQERWAAGVRCWACWGAQGVHVRADGCAGCVARSGRVGGRELGAGARVEGERQQR